MSDVDDMVRLFSTADRRDRLMRLFGIMDAADMERFGNGLLNIYVMLDREFERRFPVEFAAWQKRIGNE